MIVYEIVDTLSHMNIQECLVDEPLKNHTSIRIGGGAKLLVKPKTKKQVTACINFFVTNNIKFFVIGNGSNLLVSDDGYDGVVIKLGRNLCGYKISDNSIYADAGMSLFELNKICKLNGLSGLEFSYGIPGSVGGAICMNAGSFGHSIGEFLDYCLVLENGKLKKVKAKKFEFEYRHSIVKQKGWVVLGAKFNLIKKEPREVELLQNEYFQKKLATQPYSELSFGSVFKRKDGEVAISKIIDDLKLKGKSFGDAEISKKHAGFIINKGTATCKDCLKLIKYIQKKIQQHFGFCPELEVQLLGVKEDEIIR